MNRRTQLLLWIATTVCITQLLGWILMQALVIRPAIGEREPMRIREVGEAAELMKSGMSTQEIEERRGIDLRLFHGDANGPPPGKGWIRHDTDQQTIWKRDGGNYEIAVWAGGSWVAIQEHLPYGTTVAVALVAVAIPVIILMFGLSQRTNRQLEHVEDSLSKIAGGKLHERLDEQTGNKEVRRMSAAINRMADRLQALIESDRQRMAGLSHELRTPLTRIRLELELARREGGAATRLDRIERDIEEFDSMLTEMLELARLEMLGERLATRETVDLAGLAQLIAEDEGWRAVELRGSGMASIDKALVTRLIKNLIRNSTQHAPEAQRWIEVSDDRISVGDDGPGLSPDQADRVLRPFERGDSSKGHGLGLAIVAEIAKAHNATVTLSKPPGFVVSIDFA